MSVKLDEMSRGIVFEGEVGENESGGVKRVLCFVSNHHTFPYI